MALWLATLVAQGGVIGNALAGEPSLTNASCLIGIAGIIPHLPGLLVLGGVCAVFRDSCYTGRSLGSDDADDVIVLLGDALSYMLITYWIARGLLQNAATRSNARQRVLVTAGIVALSANAILTIWMVWPDKPYYVHPVPGFSALSLILGAMTFASAFSHVRPRTES